MVRFLVGLGLVFLVGLGPEVLGADPLPESVQDAVKLELAGRLDEALEGYRAALTSEPLVGDEALALPSTVFALSKAAHLAVDLGQGEEAWDLASRLLGSKNADAVEAGTLVRMRMLRLQGRAAEALALNDAYAQAFPHGTSSASLLTEVWRCRLLVGKAGTVAALVEKRGGTAAWVVKNDAELLTGPTDALGLSFQEPTRLQVGAFQDWGRALTLIDMLREKGWVPQTEVKTGPKGEVLHVVYVVSRQPATDRSRLEAQGLTALPN
jgi:hypothetical protein